MPTANRLDKDTNRLDGAFMNNYHEEGGAERRLMLFCQHHNNCNEKYQNAVIFRRLAEDQSTKALLDKYKETSRKDNVSLAQDKASKPKVAVKSEQPPASDPSRSHKDTLADNKKEPSSSSSLATEHSRETIVEIESGGNRSLSTSRNNYTVVTSGAVVKQEGGVSLSSSCPHQTTDAVSKSLSANTSSTQHQSSVMGLCDTNNSSSYNEGKSTRKCSIGNITTTNGFVGLPGKPDDELNLNAESFISENATINFLPSVDAENPDPLPVRKPSEPTGKQSLSQRTSLTSSRSEEVSIHESDVEKGMDEFSKVMDQIIKREEGVSHQIQMRRNSSSTSLCQLPELPQLPPTTSATGNTTNGNSTSPPPYPGTSLSTNNPVKQAAQQLASTKTKYQHLVASMEQLPNVSQPPTPLGAVESSWQQQQQQQQQQIMAAKQQMMMQQQQQQQQHYHNAHPAKPTPMQRKPQQQQQQQQQYDFLKSASPNVTIVNRDPYHSGTTMNMPQQQQQQHAMLQQQPMTINQHQQMIHINATSVQTMGQHTQILQQPQATMSISRNQPQLYAPLPNVDPYNMGPGVDQQHSALTTRSGSITYGGPVDGHHVYQQLQRRHSMPPQLPTQQHAQWQAAAAMQHQDLMYEGFCSPSMDPHHQHSMAGQKRPSSYLPPHIAAPKRNSIQHCTVLSHTMSPAAFQQQQPSHGTLVNGELSHQAYHNPINDPLLHFDSRNDLFNQPL